jgi:hypothetical protein
VKICKECKVEKEIDDYYLKNGKPKSAYCKSCYNIIYKKEYDKEYYENNKEKFKENHKRWCELNDRTEYMKEYRLINPEKFKECKEENKEKLKDSKKKWRENLSDEKKLEIKNRERELYHLKNRKEVKRKYVNEKLKNDQFFKLKFNIRSLIRNAFKRLFTEKSKKTIEILGCSFEEFKIHLESQFDENMNWENQGKYWHMDHIIPISSAKTEEDVLRLNHYTNFQPLYWEDNLKKSDKYLE